MKESNIDGILLFFFRPSHPYVPCPTAGLDMPWLMVPLVCTIRAHGIGELRYGININNTNTHYTDYSHSIEIKGGQSSGGHIESVMIHRLTTTTILYGRVGLHEYR